MQTIETYLLNYKTSMALYISAKAQHSPFVSTQRYQPTHYFLIKTHALRN